MTQHRQALTGMRAAGAALCFCALAGMPATAQQNSPSTLPLPAPGMFEAIGKFFSRPKEIPEQSGQAARDVASGAVGVAKGAVGAAKDVGETVSKLPGTRVVEGRERCDTAANGGPDCRAAAEAVCRARGYAGGQSLDTQSRERCSARVWLSGRSPAPGECSTETHVIRAICQ